MESNEELLVHIEDAIVCGKIVELRSALSRTALVDAHNRYAVAHLLDIQKRSLSDIPTIFVTDSTMLNTVVTEFGEKARVLAEQFWPGALDLVLAARPNLPDILSDGMAQVRVRVPSDPFLREILQHIARPLAAYESADSLKHPPAVEDPLVCCIEHEGLEYHDPLTVTFDPEANPCIFSWGATVPEEITNLIGPCRVCGCKSIPACLMRLGYSRYQPMTPLAIMNLSRFDINDCKDARIGFLTFGKSPHKTVFSIAKNLSEKGDPIEAAAMLYPAIRGLHAMDLQLIVAELLPDQGMGSEINERLRLAGIDVAKLTDTLNICS